MEILVNDPGCVILVSHPPLKHLYIPFGPAIDAIPGTASESFQSLQVVVRAGNPLAATS